MGAALTRVAADFQHDAALVGQDVAQRRITATALDAGAGDPVAAISLLKGAIGELQVQIGSDGEIDTLPDSSSSNDGKVS